MQVLGRVYDVKLTGVFVENTVAADIDDVLKVINAAEEEDRLCREREAQEGI